MLSRCHMSRAASIYKSSTLFTFRDLQKPTFRLMRNGFSTSMTTNLTKTRNVLNQRSTQCLTITAVRNLSVKSVESDATNFPIEIPDIPTAPLPEELLACAEPTFASIGLGGWTPVGILQNSLEFLHISCDLPWFATIVVSTVIIRILLTPVVIIARRNAAKMHNVMPEMQAIQLKMTEARQMGNAYDAARYGQELAMLMKDRKCNPIKNMLVPLAQAPIFISYFVGIRQMVNAPVESLQTGGLWWFQDLTMSDPYFILPVITCTTLFLTIELGTDSAQIAGNNMQMVKYVLRGIPLVVFPFIMNFPCAMVCYWATSNFVSLLQAGVLKIPAIRDLCKIEKHIKFSKDQLPMKKKKFIEGVKESWSNMKLSRELEDRRRLDAINFQRAAQAPMIKTYKYDPTKPRTK